MVVKAPVTLGPHLARGRAFAFVSISLMVRRSPVGRNATVGESGHLSGLRASLAAALGGVGGLEVRYVRGPPLAVFLERSAPTASLGAAGAPGEAGSP